MKKILSKISEPKRPIKSANIERAQARKIKEEGWIFLEERPALIGKIVRACRTKIGIAVRIDESKKEYSSIIVNEDRKTGEYKLDQMEDSAHEQIEECTERSKRNLKAMGNSLMLRSEISQPQGLAFGYFENPSTTVSPLKRLPQGF